MAVIDHTASTVNLAKSILMGLDRARPETPVQTETLRLLLETLIELGAPPINGKVADSAARTVLGHVASVNGVERGRGG